MTMKLLSKSEVTKAQADAKKREIDEGLKLARKVDNLREIRAQEEASLNKFRKEIVTKINAEISVLEKEKETITGEVSQLKRERRELMKPLETEWAGIHKANAELADREDNVAAMEISISKREKETKNANAKASDLLARTSLKDERTAKLLTDADKKAKQATTALQNAREVEAKALSLKKEVEKELAERDMAMAVKEREFEMRKENFKKKEVDLDREWVKLEDRKAMIERRIKKT